MTRGAAEADLDVRQHRRPRQQPRLLEHHRTSCRLGHAVAKAMLPGVGRSSPAGSRSSVLLPQPLRPTIATNCPAGMWRSMPRSTRSCRSLGAGRDVVASARGGVLVRRRRGQPQRNCRSGGAAETSCSALTDLSKCRMPGRSPRSSAATRCRRACRATRRSGCADTTTSICMNSRAFIAM